MKHTNTQFILFGVTILATTLLFGRSAQLIQFFASNYLATLVIAIISAIYLWISRPAYIRFGPDKIENIPNGKLLARAHRSRKAGKLPPSYPTGWFKIASSSDITVGGTMYIEFFGEHLVLFRGENGKVGLLDAYCPHLGANLAVEGKVEGNCIECPFHGWQFNQEGKCTHIPYTDKVPEMAKTRSWPVVEVNEMIIMYFDALHRMDEITWHPPEVPEIQSDQFAFHGKFENYVEAHIQEIPENGSDVAHLGVLHVPFALRVMPFITHLWTAEWTASEDQDTLHIANIKLTQTLLFLGKPIPFTSVETRIRQIGPGLVYLEIFSKFAKFVVIETVTPMEPLFQKVTHQIYGPKSLFCRFLAKIILASFSEQFNRDVVIWNNKAYIHKPIIVKNDGNILGFRRWYAKFYPPQDQLPEKKDMSW